MNVGDAAVPTMRRVAAEVNYIANPPGPGGRPLEFVTEDETRSTMRTRPGRTVWIHDARGTLTDLDREGFELVTHRSSVTDFDAIEEDPLVDARYGDELTTLLTALTGATRVIMLGGAKKRFGETATEKLAALANGKPARYPHADNTDGSSVQLAKMIEQFVPGVELASCSRWALYNMWRCVTPPPQDIPLAVCDARTVAPADEVTVVAITMVRGAGDYRHDTTGYLYAPDHRWHYYSAMTPEEVLVFKAYDSEPHRAGRVPHTAFDDPSCPPGTATRGSVEARALALFA